MGPVGAGPMLQCWWGTGFPGRMSRNGCCKVVAQNPAQARFGAAAVHWGRIAKLCELFREDTECLWVVWKGGLRGGKGGWVRLNGGRSRGEMDWVDRRGRGWAQVRWREAGRKRQRVGTDTAKSKCSLWWLLCLDRILQAPHTLQPIPSLLPPRADRNLLQGLPWGGCVDSS